VRYSPMAEAHSSPPGLNPPKGASSGAAAPPPATLASASSSAAAGTKESSKTAVNSKEIHTYTAPWPIYGLAASMKEGPDYTFRYAIGSFVEEYSNKVIVSLWGPRS
jgi:hypothetical protein